MHFDRWPTPTTNEPRERIDMHDDTASNGLLRQHCTALRSVRTYVTMIGAAALSALALHMVRSTTAADMPRPTAQHLTLPVDLHAGSIDTSLQPVGI
jgi:hypothetical protein